MQGLLFKQWWETTREYRSDMKDDALIKIANDIGMPLPMDFEAKIKADQSNQIPRIIPLPSILEEITLTQDIKAKRYVYQD